MATTPLNTSPSSASTFAAVPPEIPGAKQIIGPPADPELDPFGLWGVNRAAAAENFPNNGLQVYIEKWGRMSVGDRVSVRLDDTEVNSELIQPGEVDQRLTTFVPFSNLDAAPWRKTLHYTIKRLGQVEESSVPISIYVKLDRPGGRDEDGSIPGHTELKFSLPADIVRGGVDADAAKAGVRITIDPYPNMTWRDIIKVSWGGHFIFHEVQEDEVGNAVVVIADEATIVAAGDSGPNGLAVTYEVYDLVENRSEDWAKETRVNVNAGNSRLEAPFVKDTPRDTLDLDKLGDNPAVVQVVARNRALMGMLSEEEQREENKKAEDEKTRIIASLSTASLGLANLDDVMRINADYAEGDQIIVRLQGTTLEGAVVDHEEPAVAYDYGRVYEIPVDNLIVRSLAKTQVVFSYRVLHQDGTESTSKGAFIQVVGEPERLAAPIARDLEQGAIDPDLPRTTIEIPWDDSMEAGDVIILRWIGSRPDHSVYDPELPLKFISRGDAQDKLPILMVVEGSHLKTIEGGTLELYYQLEKEIGGSSVLRESVHLPLILVGEPRAELDAPIVSNVVNGVMDPDVEIATLTVPPYRGMVVGDEVFRQWEGSKTGPDEDPDSVMVNSRLVGNPIPFDIRGSRFIKPNEGGDVAASYWVIRAGNTRSDSNLTTFSVGAPVPLDPPTIGSITDSKGEVPEDGATVDRSLNVTGKAAANREVDIFDGSVNLGMVTANANGDWSKQIDDLAVGAHVIWARARYGDQAQSEKRNLTVIALVTPTISNVKDSKNVEIPDNGATFDTSVTLTGNASANLAVRILDGAADKGTATASASGTWTHTVDGLSAAAHSFTAQALYGSGEVSAAHRLTVLAAAGPVITSVKETREGEDGGGDIPEGQTRVAYNVTVSGTAAANQKLDIFDNNLNKGEVTVDGTGNWTKDLPALSFAKHSITAKGKYGDNPVSPARTFTLVRGTIPTIDTVADSSTPNIPDHGSTTETELTLSGAGSAGRRVEILDNGDHLYNVTPNGSAIWTARIPALTVGPHTLLARARYSDRPQSSERHVTVVQVTKVDITSVKDSKGVEIPDGGTTVETAVTIAGTVTYS